jgi:MFS family permease
MTQQENQPYQAHSMRNFLALWTTSVASYFIYWMMQLALSLFANRLTRSPFLISGVTFALIVPTFLFSLFAGALVDRYDRRWLLFIVTVLRLITFALALLCTLLGYLTLPLLYSIAFILGITQTLEEPALATIMPMIVHRTKLEWANTWLVGAQNFISLLALPLGGVLASISAPLTMGIGGGCAVIAFIALLLLRGVFLPSSSRDRHHIVIEVIDGMRFLWKLPILRAIGLMAGVINACWGGYLAILVLYVVAPGPMKLSTSEYGILLMGSSVGSVLGAFLTVPIEHWLGGRRWSIGLNILGNAVMFVAPVLTTNVWIIGGAAIVGGFTGPLWTITVTSFIGRMFPTELQGRVNAAYRFFGEGLAAVGPLLVGLIAQLYGLRMAFALCTCMTILMFVPFFLTVTEEAMNQEYKEK